MPTIVQKFGGTSVADVPRILRCARRVAEARQAGNDVVVVVSAMGHTTDELVELAKQISDAPSPREMDMLMATGEQVSIALLSIALHSLRLDAVSMTGPQMGMMTNEVHSKARIQAINVERIRRELGAGGVVVAAGCRGGTADGQSATPGRGGSDTAAVALPRALSVHARGASRQAAQSDIICEILADVDGIYTAHPRCVPNARKLDRITYEEMLELASQGA